MRTYITNDGHRFLVANARELLRQLRAETWSGPTGSKREWMADMAERAEQSTGKPVRIDSDAHFVTDLIATGLIKEEEG